ncbi:MAG: GIY-YIG nuclease family protein [Balneola sp.]|jgi:putative endonuclease|tara:strand:- start:62 stop:418 length:357 start_codon:yes stop_codon:yes gene_type:complete
MDFAVYITTNPNRSVLYTGTTNTLSRRVIEHYLEKGKNNTFTGKTYCYNLVYYDLFPTMREAIEAEKRIKGKSRKWKEELISTFNPDWKFLNKEIVGEWPPKKVLEDPYFQQYLKKDN